MRLLACAGLALAFLSLGPAAGAGPNAVPMCFNDPATIVGTEGNDTLVGSAGDDVIVGLGGDDDIRAGGGEDVLCGGPGNDRVDGGADRDFVEGGDGNDQVIGGPGRNFLRPGAGDDDVVGGENTDFAVFNFSPAGVRVDLASRTASGEGSDRLGGIEHVVGSDFADVLVGDGDSNTFYGLEGDDRIDGGGDLDVLRFSFSTRRITASLQTGTASGEGSDTFVRIELLGGSDQGDVLTGGGGTIEALLGEDGDDRLLGGASSDLLEGGPGVDRLEGGPGTDFLAGGPGDDTLLGGGGVDEATYEEATARVSIDLGRGSATGEGNDRLGGIEQVVGSAFEDVLVGGAGADVLEGGGGRDVIRGAAGDDYLDGGEGFDALEGGRGRDYCLDHRGQGCELSGVPGRLPVRALAAAAAGGETGELGTALCTAGSPVLAFGHVANRRPPGASITPPARLRPRPARGPLGLATQHEATRRTVTWQATLFRYDQRARRFVRFRSSPRLTAVADEVDLFGSLAWSTPDGRQGRATTVALPPGRYAWAAELRFDNGERIFDWVEPHTYVSGAGSRYRPACTASR